MSSRKRAFRDDTEYLSFIRESMKFVRSESGLMLAGSYALVATIVLYFDFQSQGISQPSFWLTFPWNAGVIYIGFFLFTRLCMGWNMDSLSLRC